LLRARRHSPDGRRQPRHRGPPGAVHHAGNHAVDGSGASMTGVSLAQNQAIDPEAATYRQARLLTGGLFALLALALVRTAWLCDDAFINFRTIDNVLHGYGLRWNVAERVQSFTDPLWLFRVTALVGLTRVCYYTVSLAR